MKQIETYVQATYSRSGTFLVRNWKVIAWILIDAVIVCTCVMQLNNAVGGWGWLPHLTYTQGSY